MSKISKMVLSRQELYDLVWSTPMIDLAKQFNLSDNGLRKICKKYLVPIPKMGYWQKFRFGKKVSKIVLPPSQNDAPIAINVLPRNKEQIESQIIVKEAVVVPDRVGRFHPLVQQTRKLFAKGHEYNGRTRSYRGEAALGISVSRKMLPRALRIMDTIIKVLEEHGAKVGIDRENELRTNTHVTLEGEKVQFGIDELMRIVKTEPDQYGYSRQEYVPKEKLVLRIKNYLGGCQSKWTEGENTKLEDKLASFINGLSFAAAYLKKQRKEREEEQRRWEERRQSEARRQQILEEEKKRGEVLEKQAVLWKKSRVIYDFIQAAISARGDFAPDSEFGKWVTWAKAYADKLDPLKP